jgi:hypothetical protein
MGEQCVYRWETVSDYLLGTLLEFLMGSASASHWVAMLDNKSDLALVKQLEAVWAVSSDSGLVNKLALP